MTLGQSGRTCVSSRERRALFVFPVHDNTRREARPDTGAWYSGTLGATSLPLFPQGKRPRYSTTGYGMDCMQVQFSMRAYLMHVCARPPARLARRA